jgi:hypothetical protein
MTNRLELAWNLDGFVDEQRYYCSETPIDVNNMPTPKAILLNSDRSYVDTNIEANKTYYVAVGSVKNGVEKLSDEVEIKASNIDQNYRVKLLTKNGVLIDNGYSELTWSKIGTVVYNVNNQLDFNQGSYLKSDQTFLFNSEFEFEFEFYISSTLSDSYFGLIANTESTWGSGGFQISVGGSNVGYESNKLFCGFYGRPSIVSNIDVTRDAWHKAKVTFTGGEFSIYLDDMNVASGARGLPNNGFLVVGASMSTGAIKIRNFKCK